MSYTIIYDKNFIKVEQENKETVYCPMIYAGSNNCYEYSYNGRERRERSWFPFTHISNGKLLATKEEMLAKMEEERQEIIERYKDSDDKYKDSSFGYFTGLSIGGGGCNATYGQYKGIVLTGTKKSLTVEQCVENGISVVVRSGYDSNKKLKEEYRKRVETTEEFLQAIKECEEHVKGTTVSVTVDSHASENTMKWMRKRMFPKTKKEKVLKEVDHFFAVYLPGVDGYYYKGTKNGYRYTEYPGGGKKYETEKDAQKTVNRLNKRRGSEYSEVKKIELENKITIWV